jgi:hypothetical protein
MGASYIFAFQNSTALFSWNLSHRRIHNNVSVYIVALLQQIHCYATGTVTLLWKCNRMHRGTQYVTIYLVFSGFTSRPTSLLASNRAFVFFCIATYSGVLFHDGTLLHSKSQYTTVKHNRQLLEHTYTSDPHGLGTLTPIEFFQQDVLCQSSITRSHSCSIKLPNTRRDNPSKGYRFTCTPQRHFGV